VPEVALKVVYVCSSGAVVVIYEAGPVRGTASVWEEVEVALVDAPGDVVKRSMELLGHWERKALWANGRHTLGRTRHGTDKGKVAYFGVRRKPHARVPKRHITLGLLGRC
jgi:hypothetical protein